MCNCKCEITQINIPISTLQYPHRLMLSVFLIDFRVEFVDELPKGNPPVEKVVWCICSRLESETYSVDCFLIV